jgi:gamma-butyrobetaine dioxygenase
MSLLNRPLSFTQRRIWTTITRTRDGLTLHALGHKVFPYIWLRDSCVSPASVHPSTKQKLHRTSDIPLDIAPIDGEGGVRVVEAGLEIQWNDGTRSMFEKHWLERHASPVGVEMFHWDNTLKQLPWTRASIFSSPSLFLPYQEILSSDEGLEKAMVQLAKYGLLFVRSVPNDESSDENCELKKLAENFGELRKTFYGLVWNVISLKDSKNIAYTNLELGLHMDLL